MACPRTSCSDRGRTVTVKSPRAKGSATAVRCRCAWTIGKKLAANPKVTLYENAELKEIRGDEFVESIVVAQKGATREIKVDGLFIEMGLVPNSELVADLNLTDANGRIAINSRCATKKPGIFAAGDVTDIFVEQVLIAIGEGAKASLSAYEYLLNQ